MGADGDHRPGPNPKDPRFPCGVGSGDVPVKPNLSNLPKARSKAGQVDEPPSYAIAGKALLAASGAFAAILLALIALHMYNRSRHQHFRHRRRLLRSLAISGAGEERDGAEAPSPRGLDPAVLRALPVLSAGPGAGDCAVCLTEFEPGEKARVLPRCGHRFHVECIDAWFRGNSTCPLCRADVEAPDTAAAEAQPEVRIEVAGATAAAAAAVKGRVPAMGRLPSGTDLEKTRRIFASTRSASF